MSFDAQRLYDLLPAIYRIRDAEHDGQLRALLAVIAEQVGVLEENLDQLYDDQFIETCAEWVVPYIGDLIGYRSLHSVAPQIGSPRAEVAHTIAFRRRKGTAAMLEQLARDVTGWNARVVEFFQLLATTQYMNHLRPNNWYAPDMRQWEPLERLNTPFDTVAHTVDVRRIAISQGLYNIPNIGVFLWRLTAYPLTNSPAVKFKPADPNDRRYLFSPLGLDTPLFTRPETEKEISHLADPINVPMPISRRVLDAHLTVYYGKQKSLFLRVDDADIDPSEVESCDLSDGVGGSWAHQPATKIAIDPVLGRIAFAQTPNPPGNVTVSFHYGFSADVGGGEYPRLRTIDLLPAPIEKVPSPHLTIQDALTAAAGRGVVEIGDTGRYEETPSISVNTTQRLELRAANEHRPTLILGGDVEITGEAESEVIIDGLLISGGTLRVSATPANKLRRLRLRHCTLVPGPQPSVVVELADVTVEIEQSILGGLRVAEGATVKIIDSIVDATSESAVAFAAVDGVAAGGMLETVDTTIIGKVYTHELRLASNSIFHAALATGDPWTAPVRSDKKQAGCVRFSYLPLTSVVPRRYRCQPDLEIGTLIDQAEEKTSTTLTQTERDAIRADVEAWLIPTFTATGYAFPGYLQLRLGCPLQIRAGADDEAEMGVFHKLYQPQRDTNLRVRLEEYLRFGLEAGRFYVT